MIKRLTRSRTCTSKDVTILYAATDGFAKNERLKQSSKRTITFFGSIEMIVYDEHKKGAQALFLAMHVGLIDVSFCERQWNTWIGVFHPPQRNAIFPMTTTRGSQSCAILFLGVHDLRQRQNWTGVSLRIKSVSVEMSVIGATMHACMHAFSHYHDYFISRKKKSTQQLESFWNHHGEYEYANCGIMPRCRRQRLAKDGRAVRVVRHVL